MKWSSVLLLIFCIFACKPTQQSEEKTPQVAFEPEIEKQISYLTVPIVIKVNDLEQKINESLKPKLIDKDVEKKDLTLHLEALRKGAIDISFKGNDLSYSIPLKIIVTVQVHKKVLILNLKKTKQIEFALKLNFKSAVALGTDWRLNTQTQFQNIDWISEPTLNLGFTTISLAPIVENELEKKKPEIEKKIDELAHDKLKLDVAVLKIWKDLQKPILINKKQVNIWLKATPIDFWACPIKSNGKNIIIKARLSAYTESMIGEQPDYQVNEKLPKLKTVASVPEDCELRLQSRLFYEDINEILNEKFKGKEFDIQGHKIKINKADVHGNGKDIIIRVDLSGAVNSLVYFKGMPMYDENTKSLKINHFDFDVKTEETLISAANWLLHDTFKDKIQEALNLPLENHVAKLPEKIEQGIENSKIGEKISLDMKSLTITPQKIVVRPESIHILILAKTTVKLKLDKL